MTDLRSLYPEKKKEKEQEPTHVYMDTNNRNKGPTRFKKKTKNFHLPETNIGQAGESNASQLDTWL